jgi:hypothetical protein
VVVIPEMTTAAAKLVLPLATGGRINHDRWVNNVLKNIT